MIEPIYILIAFGVGFYIGKMYVVYRLRKIIAKFTDAVDKESLVEVYKLKTETISGSLFLYDELGEFICQGKTLAELAELANKYNGIKYAAVMHNDKVVVFIDGVIKDTV
jgi:hypothetical protein